MGFFLNDPQDEILLGHAYSPWLVVLSFVIATSGSALALYVANSAVRSRDQRSKSLLLFSGAAAFGLAVWSMHFVGMLAFSLCTTVHYDLLVTVLSALPAMGAAWFVLRGISSRSLRLPALLRKGCVIGAGIGVMHYSGMMAMRMSASLRFAPADFALAVLAAVVLSTLALWVRREMLDRFPGRIADGLTAVIMGLAITAMHYLGMASARFVGQAEAAVPFPPADRLFLALLVTMGSTSVLGFAASGVLLSRLKDSLTELRQIKDKLQHDANHDFLTGLYNRRYFKEQLRIELDRSERSGMPLSLIMLDIDHFKRINDSFGHLAGDRVLSLVGSALLAESRSGDVVSRHGGEEFLLLLPHTDLAAVELLAERIRATMEKLELVHEGERIRFTISLGVTGSVNTVGMTSRALIAEADEALYRAKNCGRNRVETFGAAAY